MQSRVIARFFTILALATTALSAEVTGGVEYSLDADGRPWIVAHDIKTNQAHTVIYVIKGDTLESCSESFAVHTGTQKVIDFSQNFEVTFRKMMAGLFPGKPIEIHLLDQTANSLFAEWTMSPKRGDKQHGWIRIIDSDEGAVILQFTTKKVDQIQRTKKIWEKILVDAHRLV